VTMGGAAAVVVPATMPGGAAAGVVPAGAAADVAAPGAAVVVAVPGEHIRRLCPVGFAYGSFSFSMILFLNA